MPTDVDIPNELTSFSALGVSNSNYFATVFTPTAVGLFRVAMTYFSSTGNAGTPNISWTDPNGNTLNLGTTANGFTATAFIRSAANKPILVLVTGLNPPITFDVYATVEQL